MARFNDSVLEEIRARIDLAEYIGTRIQVKRSGSKYVACCPFHNEKTPSFHIDPTKGFYHCFGCGASGDVFKFMMQYEGATFQDAVHKLAEMAGVPLEETNDFQANARNRLLKMHAELAAFYQRCLKQTSGGQVARDYLAKRQLPDAIIEQFGIGYAPDREGVIETWAQHHNISLDELEQAGIIIKRDRGHGYYDRFRGRLMFPICDGQGRVIAFSGRDLTGKSKSKYTNSPETDIFKKSRTIYALHHAKAAIAKVATRQAIVCEGQIDVIRCHANGFTTAIASQGTAFTEEHVKILSRYADCVVLVFDSDTAGRKAAIRTSGLFLSEGLPVRIATLPEGEDPDSLLRDQGSDAFKRCIDTAESPAIYQVHTLQKQEQSPDAIDAVQRIAKSVIATIQACPEPMLCAKFLQDAAECLGLPVVALEEELAQARAKAEEDAARKAAYQSSARPEATPQVPSEPDPAISEDFVPDGDEWHDADGDFDEYISDEETSPAKPSRSLKDLEALNRLSLALCELLAHHFNDDDVMERIVHHLPPAFITHPYTARLLGLACKAYLARQPMLTDPKDDPGFTEFLMAQLAENSKLEYALETTPAEQAQFIITRYWDYAYHQRRDALAETSPERMMLTLSIKRLKELPWDKACAYMNAATADAFPTITPEPDTPPTPEATSPSSTPDAIEPVTPDTAGGSANVMPTLDETYEFDDEDFDYIIN